MKQVIVLSIKDYESDLQAALKGLHIPVFSKVDITGYKEREQKADPSNWFGHGSEPDFSVMYFAFVNNEVANDILSSIDDWNNNHHTSSPMHAYVVPVERSI